MFPKPKYSDRPIIRQCSHFFSSSSPSVRHQSLLSPLHSAAPQAPFARTPWLRYWLHHPRAFLQMLFLGKQNKRGGSYKRWDNIADQLFYLPLLLLSQTHNFLTCKAGEASPSWRRKKFGLSTETPRRQNTRGYFFLGGQLPFPSLHPLCSSTFLPFLFSWRLLTSRYLLWIVLFETTFIHQTRHDAASSALSSWQLPSSVFLGAPWKKGQLGS